MNKASLWQETFLARNLISKDEFSEKWASIDKFNLSKTEAPKIGMTSLVIFI